MSKIFRLHKEAAEAVVDWTSANEHLGPADIDNILDPAGESAHKQITSIPSPFARMDVVLTAFRYVYSNKQLDGNTIHHRLVSEALDIAEIFFASEALKAKNIIEIISWDPGIERISDTEISIKNQSDLGKLLTSNNDRQKLYGETLKMYLQQDRKSYNFTLLNQLYLINYRKGPEKINIIGGTSPATWFFSSANDDIRNYINNIQFGNHKVFSPNYCPLYKRTPDFIKYIYALRAYMNHYIRTREGYNQFSKDHRLFKDINNYLDQTFSSPYLSEDLKNEIREYTGAVYTENYDTLSITGSQHSIEIVGCAVKGERPDVVESDFEILSSRVQGVKPLILPNQAFNESVKYVKGQWKQEYRAPYYDSSPMHERTLPYHEHIVYPYLTISDLLEPYIIRIPYPINKDKYFNGNFNEHDHGYILPLKKSFFRYFNITDLTGDAPDGKKFFELVKRSADSVEAILRIPIKNNKIVIFSRIYTIGQPTDDSIKNEKENTGIILQYSFGMSIYPFLKTGSDLGADYRVQLIDSDTLEPAKKNNYEIHFYKQDAIGDSERINEIEPRIRSNKNDGDFATSIYYVLKKEFDIAEVRPNNFSSGLLVPLMRTFTNGTESFSFAIDFGTTNTHIECRKGNEEPQPFEISEGDIQIGSLHYNHAATMELLKKARAVFGLGIEMLTDLIPKETIPEKIGIRHDFKFPMRTVINGNKRLNTTATSYTLADFNIPFVYEQTMMPPNSVITSNLKWLDFGTPGSSEERRVKGFIENLIIMMRNKVLLNNGNLAATKIIWFYPFSMAENRRDTLEATWSQLANTYISATCRPKKLSESIAPFYYLKNRGGVLGFEPMASIDIGGGTTDIVVYEGDKPINATSFRFAINAIFGDGYNGNTNSNGFVKKYLPILEQMLSVDEVREIQTVLKQVEARKVTTDLITYFFSLENNKLIQRNKLEISFSKLLKSNDQSKIVFLFFFASVTYHLARMMRQLNIAPPRYITFSGTGSKILNAVDNNIDLRNLSGFTNVIFSSVYEKQIDTIKLIQSSEPKELTCKGGLFCPDADFNEDIEKIKTVLVGDKNGSVIVNPARKKSKWPNTPASGEESVAVSEDNVNIKGGNDAHFMNIPYNKLMSDEVLFKSVKEEVELFIDKFFGWHEEFNYNTKFGALPVHFDVLKQKMKEDLMNFLKAGLSEKLNEVRDDRSINIEESLFFYPLVGVINKMSQTVFTMPSNN